MSVALCYNRYWKGPEEKGVMITESFDMLLDYLFHAYVIYSLVSGISALKKFRKLPPEPIVTEDFSDVTGG